ncbi:MAG: RagB/SusD family nutrient uptake outer membrane protein [Prevotella sp.]|nr:RagB/SusD family nutrient uptake outer membrane protein [Prevotella sp.]
MTSCNDWLDVNPESQVEDNELFEAESGFKEALAGVYSGMVNEATYAKEMLYGAYGALAQEWVNEPTSYQDIAVYNYDAASPTSLFANIWRNNYNAIANDNNLLKAIDENRYKFSGNNYNIIKGEALALRALLHFDLLRAFGVSYEVNANMPSIPYSTELSYRVFPQLSVKEVAEKVIADLKEAEQLLKVDPIYTGEEITEAVDNGYLMNRTLHMNYYAVKGLQARVYMWTKQYDLAKAAAEEVINSGKFSWATPGTVRQGANAYPTTSEHLFALDDVNLSNRADSYFNENLNTSSFSLDATTLLDYYDSETTDYRYLYQFASGTNYDYVENRYSTKYWAPSSDAAADANRLPIIRLSELYLILSEIDYRSGGSGLDRLNELHRARNVGDLDAVVDYYGTLVREYRREFIGEGQLFFLYKRLNYPTILRSDVDPIAEKIYTFPLPQSETSAAQREANR